jgi:predicted RNA-binding Zn ribbon-like protein
MDLPELRGNRPCLDFANTVEPRRGEAGGDRREHLHGYADLVEWARHAGVLATADTEGLLAAAAARPARARAAFARAIALREAIYQVFAAVADGREPAAAELDAVQRDYAAAMAVARIRPAGGGSDGTRAAGRTGGLDWTWTERDDLERPRWALARSAVELLVSGQLDRVRYCPDCGWLFLDVTRNASRRWCSMSECGNHAKSRRLSERRRAARAAAPRRRASR